MRELGWEPGGRVDMDTLHGMILIAATPTGHHTIDHRGAIKVPAPLRRLCGIEHGPPLVLAAVVPEQVMVVHPAATVARLLAMHYTDLIRVNGHLHTGKPLADDTTANATSNDDRTMP